MFLVILTLDLGLGDLNDSKRLIFFFFTFNHHGLWSSASTTGVPRWRMVDPLADHGESLREEKKKRKLFSKMKGKNKDFLLKKLTYIGQGNGAVLGSNLIALNEIV